MNLHTTGQPSPVSPPQEAIDSGMECLTILAAHYRRSVDKEHVKHELNSSGRQLNAGELTQAAKLAGLKAKLFIAKSLDKLIAAPRPAIVQLGLKFVLLVAVEGEKFQILDPVQRTQHVVHASEFQDQWSGVFLLVTRRPNGLADRFGLAWFSSALKKYKRELALVLLASLFVQILSLATPLLFQIVIDKVLVHNSIATLTAVVVGLSHSIIHVTTGPNIEATDRLMKAAGAKFVGGA